MTQPTLEPEGTGARGRGRRRRRTGVLVAGVVAGAVVVGAVVAVRTGAGMTDVFALEVGDCVNGVSGAEHTEEFASAPVVPCSEPHEAEVITSFRLAGDRYPGEEQVVAESQERCTGLIVAELPTAPRPGELLPFYFYPTVESWEHADDRTVHCLAMPTRGRITGSLLDP